MTELATLFQQAKTGCIVVEGRRINSILRIPVEVPSLMKVRQLHATTDPLPGLRFAIRDGTATLDGKNVPDLVLWSDTGPGEVEIKIIPKRKKIATAMLWNCWRDYIAGHSVMQAWLVNSGMLVEHSNNEWVLRCNSGPNAALSFDDLIVAVHVITQSKS